MGKLDNQGKAYLTMLAVVAAVDVVAVQSSGTHLRRL
jgi:hypothetical protein